MSSTLQAAVTRGLLGVIGAGLAVLLLVAARPSSEPRQFPARVEVTAPATGEVATAPAAPDTLMRAALLPSRPKDAAFEIRNQTGSALSVAIVADADTTELDGSLGVRLTEGRRVLSDSTLQALRRGSLPVRLASGESTEIRVTMELPASATDYQGRDVAIELTPKVETAR